MTSATSLAFPGGRTLATWWQQLASFKPVGLGVGYFFVHRLDAQAAWFRAQPLDPLALLVLEAILMEEACASGSTECFCARLQRRLPLELPILRRLTQTLEQAQLIECGRLTGPVVDECRLTDRGQQARRSGAVPVRHCQRDTFTFVERLGPTGQRMASPHFLRLAEAPAAPWLACEATGVPISQLRACAEETPEWKSTFGFPLDVEAFPESSAGSPVAPEQVIIDRPERLLAVFCQTREQELLGFGVRPEGWALVAGEPIARLTAAAADVLGLDRSPAAPMWKQAWSSWCQARALPRVHADECSLTLVEERLRVAAPERLIHTLEATKSDQFSAENWILAGDGYARQAARLELLPTCTFSSGE
jgi:hypothetical protein